jgi:hypothetical protein
VQIGYGDVVILGKKKQCVKDFFAGGPNGEG